MCNDGIYISHKTEYPSFYDFVCRTAYSMQKSNDKSLEKATLFFQGSTKFIHGTHLPWIGNDHRVVCKLTIYPCNKLLYCFRDYTNNIQNGHCSMCWYPSRRVSQLLHFSIALQYIFHKTEYPNLYAFLGRNDVYYSKN